MKEDNSFRAMDALIRNLSQHQKSILADAENLKKLYMNWTSATAKIETGLQMLMEQLRAGLVKMKQDNSFRDMDTLVRNLTQNQKSVLVDVQNLQNMNWTSATAKELSDFMQRKLHLLQNPDNCDAARKLICVTSRQCGFGCQTHHIMYCSIMAYWTGRTLVLQSQGWIYSREKGWEGAFLPLSNTCTTATGAVPWDTDHNTKQVVSVPFVSYLKDPPPFMPQAIPKELADKLFTFHQHPFLWFAGQILLYLLRPNEQLRRFIADRKKALDMKKPYAGVQVRRTDKLIEEAKLHRLDEYMVRVEEWYRLYGMTHEVDKKRVFIATDDPSVITEAKTKYTDYEVYGDDRIVQTAQTKSRYSLESLFGIIFDVQMLAESDYFACTFSSNVGRLSFELMQTFHVDASKKGTSVDEDYFFFGQTTDKQIVM